MSGGRATVAHKRGEANRQGGDICSVSPEGHVLTDRFYLECKFYKDLCFSTFAINGKGPLAGFWAEAIKKAAQHEREPVLIAKQNNIPTLVITKFDSVFNKHPVARLHETAQCDVGLLDRILKQKFDITGEAGNVG